MIEPPNGDDWVALSLDPLPLAEVCEWAVTPRCGALVTFAGTVRDHAPGRDGVEFLEYEAYGEQVVPRLQLVVDEARRRWPVLGRLVALHRTGRLELTEIAVVVAATSPSRQEAFEAARFLIDTVKATVPIWKHETWQGGSDWSDGTCAPDAADDAVELDRDVEHAVRGQRDVTELLGEVRPVPVVLRPVEHGLRSPRLLNVEREEMPLDGPLRDSFGRVHTDLRISVTDRCNFRCTYCMPDEGITFAPNKDLLSVAEIARVAGLARRLGVESVRVTGGEPLVRKDIVEIVAALGQIGFSDLAMTTNGSALARLAPALAAAGLRRVNVSCDSLDPQRFAAIRRRGQLAVTLEAMDVAEAAGLVPLKVNVVLIEGENDDEVLDLAHFARETGRTVRFIEFMPLDGDGGWRRDRVIAGADVRAAIEARYPLVPIDGGPGDHAPATRYRFADGRGEVGFVNSVTEPFCGTCDRLRLMADGAVRNCLFSDDELSLRDAMRAGADDDELELLVRRSVWGKFPGHGINEPGFLHPLRSMSRIGG